MNVALIGAELEENLALRYLEASLRQAGHQTHLLDFHDESQAEAVVRAAIQWPADVIGLSMVFTLRADEFVRLAGRLREAGFRGHLTAGGHFASFHAARLLTEFPAFDSIVHGEGEETIVDLVAHLDRPSMVAGVSWRGRDGRVHPALPRRNPDDLDSRPWPTRPEQFPHYLGLPIANMLAGRGCFANCHFCSINAWYRQNSGRRFRQRTADCVAREMAYLYHERGVRLFNFHDDNFFLPNAAANVARFRHWRQTLDRLNVGPIGIQVKARPDSVEPEVVAALKDLGLFRVFLGVESGTAAGLRALGRGTTVSQNEAALRILHQADLHVTFNLLIFEPDTTPADLRDNLALMRRWAMMPMNFCRTEVYSGTALEQRLRTEGRLLGDYFGYHYRIADPAVQQAFEIMRHVFTRRNFLLGGVNLRTMEVDYLLHILGHFRPDRLTAELRRAAAEVITAVNHDSATKLERIVDFVTAGGAQPESEAAAFAQAMAREREAVDLEFHRRIDQVIDRLHQAAQQEPTTLRQRLVRVSTTAAAVVLATVCTHGCEMAPKPSPDPPAPKTPEPDGTEPGTHMFEMAPSPGPGETSKVDPVAPGAARRDVLAPPKDDTAVLVAARIAQEYQSQVDALAREKTAYDLTLAVRLELDKSGKVARLELLGDRGFEGAQQEFVAELTQRMARWTFPEVKKAAVCEVTLSTPMDPQTHMTEWLVPSLDKVDGYPPNRTS
jgi:radical SAM superfamily enzyme YgiQ (UPF0313 family)